MRPVRLEMNGFAAFREPATVDFSGAEYFVLVGPTGSGKSTVLDAITFALYGTVPRWEDRRTVALALAPTVNRGTVRLVFDVGERRYVVARELRRAANGNVSVKNARLERLADPAGTGSPAEDTTVLAADAQVSAAVEDLLGLPFHHFCTCVVLPQGAFAEFLHAKPADRQKILTQLLGLGVYESIAKRAGALAGEQQQRAALLTDQIAAFADATGEAADRAGARVGALAALAALLDRRLPDLVRADALAAAAGQDAARVAAERERLAALRIPAAHRELDARRRQRQADLDAAGERFALAEAADTEARRQRAAAPARGPLEQARRDHAALAAALAAEPAAGQQHARAQEALGRAGQQAADARAALDAARAAASAADSDARAAADAVTVLAGERDHLVAVRPPRTLPALVARLDAAREKAARAQAALAAAEAGESAAGADLAAAGPRRSPLEQARRDHEELAAGIAALPDLERRCGTAAQDRAAAAEQFGLAQQRAERAAADREAAVRVDLAAELRAHLVAGQPCPVCEQQVAEVPAALPADRAQAAAAGLAAAERQLNRARTAQAQAERAEHDAVLARDQAKARIDRLGQALAGQPATLAAVAQELAALDRLEAAARVAGERLRAGRAARDAAETALGLVTGEVTAATAELHAARGELVGLGAPRIGGDLRAGWESLAAWAGGQAAERDKLLEGARTAAAAAALTAASAQQALKVAAGQEEHARAAERAATRAEQQARSRLEQLAARAAELRDALASAPADAAAADELARLDALDAAAAAAEKALLDARTRRDAAERARSGVRGELDAAWTALHAARDGLSGLGAPAMTGHDPDLLAAWTGLTAWAHAEVARRDAELPAAQAAAAAAEAAAEAVRGDLAGRLGAHDVVWEQARPFVDAAPLAVAGALERARAEHRRITERRDHAAGLARDRDAAQEGFQVSRMLAALLRSDAFPRWLVASALDTLVADASRSLAELSGGQFALTHEDGRFEIIDHTDADARRPVKTLSGGETFQASLALALALSAQVCELAAAGAPRLDSIFLDEGFGTLDETTLETVASTLETLATSGNRIVGVITHVRALAERVPVRFTVNRDQRTASIARDDT
jgi:DNA repair protein SbcC/Rad50